MTSPPERPPAPAAAPIEGLGDRAFVLVCLSHVLGYFSNGLLGPTLPLYLVAQGHGEAFVGLVLAAYSTTSFSVRLLVGQLVDAGHVRATLRATGFILGLAPFAYLVPLTPVLFLTRAVHGLGWAGLNVAGSAWAGMLAPVHRRAEALGYFTMAQRIGGTAAQVLGLSIAAGMGFYPVFMLAGVVGLLVAACAQFTRPESGQAGLAATRVRLGPGDLFNLRRLFAIERGALLGAGLQTLIIMTSPAAVTYMPLYFRHQGLEHVELYFLAVGVTGIAGRALVGQWADRIGRIRSIALGFGLQFGGLALLGFASGFWPLVAGGVIYTFGNVLSEPSLYALAIDRSDPARRGAAMATYTSAFQLGSGLGAAVGGAVIQELGYEVFYRLELLPAALGLVWLAAYWRRSSATRAAAAP